MVDSTVEYYNKNAEQFLAETTNVEFSETQNTFLKLLPDGAMILDFGCGSGRDALEFLRQGYQVDATDGSAKMCRAASELTGLPVRQMFFQDLNEKEKYDRIWACSFMLHLPRTALKDVLVKMCMALKESGIAYSSFKYGAFEGKRNDRYFTDFTEESFVDFISCMNG